MAGPKTRKSTPPSSPPRKDIDKKEKATPEVEGTGSPSHIIELATTSTSPEERDESEEVENSKVKDQRLGKSANPDIWSEQLEHMYQLRTFTTNIVELCKQLVSTDDAAKSQQIITQINRLQKLAENEEKYIEKLAEIRQEEKAKKKQKTTLFVLLSSLLSFSSSSLSATSVIPSSEMEISSNHPLTCLRTSQPSLSWIGGSSVTVSPKPIRLRKLLKESQQSLLSPNED